MPQVGPDQSGNFRQKNDHSSESVCSIDSGIIFIPRSGHDTVAGEMTRRAFSALRVIRLKGKSTSRMAQDFP